MAKLEDILKSKGYTDADLTALAPMLTDQRFRSTLEETYSAVETERDTYRAKDAEWERWRTDVANPRIAQTEQEAAMARRRAADFEEQLKIAKDWGLIQAETDPNKGQPIAEKPPVQSSEQFDPKKHNLLTTNDAKYFAIAQGKAMAAYQDMSAEHFTLFGKPLEGFEQMFDEFSTRAARDPNTTLKAVWEQKHNVPAKRAEVQAARQKAAEDAIRADERAKMAAQFGNPALRTNMPSVQPFIPVRANDGDPWTKTAQERKAQRIQAALRSQSQVM